GFGRPPGGARGARRGGGGPAGTARGPAASHLRPPGGAPAKPAQTAHCRGRGDGGSGPGAGTGRLVEWHGYRDGVGEPVSSARMLGRPARSLQVPHRRTEAVERVAGRESVAVLYDI